MRLNFSGSHTFSLTATVFVSPCPPECYLQSETKTEPDLRLDLHCSSSPGQIETKLLSTQLRRRVLQHFTFPVDISYIKDSSSSTILELTV